MELNRIRSKGRFEKKKTTGEKLRPEKRGGKGPGVDDNTEFQRLLTAREKVSSKSSAASAGVREVSKREILTVPAHRRLGAS